jgi:hypothetical protein
MVPVPFLRTPRLAFWIFRNGRFSVMVSAAPIRIATAVGQRVDGRFRLHHATISRSAQTIAPSTRKNDAAVALSAHVSVAAPPTVRHAKRKAKYPATHQKLSASFVSAHQSG